MSQTHLETETERKREREREREREMTSIQVSITITSSVGSYWYSWVGWDYLTSWKFRVRYTTTVLVLEEHDNNQQKRSCDFIIDFVFFLCGPDPWLLKLRKLPAVIFLLKDSIQRDEESASLWDWTDPKMIHMIFLLSIQCLRWPLATTFFLIFNLFLL